MTKYNLEKIKRIRSKNTYQQNLIIHESIKKVAIYYRNNSHDIPSPIRKLFKQKQIDLSQSIVLDFQDYSLLGIDHVYTGLIMTDVYSFFFFEVELSDDEQHIEKVTSWENVTSDYPINDRQPGIQKTYGFLAIEVLKELSAYKLNTID